MYSMTRVVCLFLASSTFATFSLLSAIVGHRTPLAVVSVGLLAFNVELLIKNVRRIRTRSLEQKD